MVLDEGGADLGGEVQEVGDGRTVVVEAGVLASLRGRHDQVAQRFDWCADRTVVDPHWANRMGASLITLGSCPHDDLSNSLWGQVDGFLTVDVRLLGRGLDEMGRDTLHRCRLHLGSVGQQHGARLRHEGLEQEGVHWVGHVAQTRSVRWSVSTKPA